MTDALVPPAEPLAAAREHAIRLLTDRYADDTLSTAEFEGRLDRLYSTATAGDVQRLVADLQVARVPAPVASPPAAPPRERHVVPGLRQVALPLAAAARRLLCVLGQRTIAGRWAAPERLEVRCVLGEVVLDLREAELVSGSEIDVFAVMGTVHLLLPAHVEVESEVGSVMGEVSDAGVVDVPATSPRPTVRLRLTGTSVMAEVAVRRVPAQLAPGVPHKQAWTASKPPRQR
jgi:hypothetical protein